SLSSPALRWSARSTYRSIACAARSRTIPKCRSTCRPCAASGISSCRIWAREMEGSTRPPRVSFWERVRGGARALRDQINRPFGYLKRYMPRGLFPRSLLIVLMPIILLQMVVTLFFFEHHYELLTRRLSRGVAGDIAMLLSIYKTNPTPATIRQLAVPAQDYM